MSNKTPTPQTSESAKSALAELFGTDDEKLIIERARAAVEIAKRPSLHLSIVFDARTGKVVVEGHDSTGAPIGLDSAFALIDAARSEMTKLEVEHRLREELAKRNASESSADAES